MSVANCPETIGYIPAGKCPHGDRFHVVQVTLQVSGATVIETTAPLPADLPVDPFCPDCWRAQAS